MVVARVGPYSISGAVFDRSVEAQLAGEPPSERLVAPGFSACVAHLTAEATAIGERALSGSQLRSECQIRYRALLQAVLERLISDEWLIGGAHELGVPLGAHRAIPNVQLDARATLAAKAIRRAIANRAGAMTGEQIASYYRQHRFDYLLSGERDVEIARTKTEAAAAKVRAEIASGRSFASVVRTLGVPQPIDSSDGFVRGLQPHVYGEPNLNQAIFTAAPKVLSGPVDTWFGYFVFEVTKIKSERVRPLAAVQASIREQLVRPRQERALAAFRRRWTAAWTARSDCSPGFVVPRCRQFTGRPLAPPEAPVALD